MRLNKMGAGFYFEPDSGERHQEMQRIAESGEQIDLVPVSSPGQLTTQSRAYDASRDTAREG